MLRHAKTHILQAALARGIVSGNLRHLISCFICVLQQKATSGPSGLHRSWLSDTAMLSSFPSISFMPPTDGAPEISSGAQPILHFVFLVVYENKRGPLHDVWQHCDTLQGGPRRF